MLSTLTWNLSRASLENRRDRQSKVPRPLQASHHGSCRTLKIVIHLGGRGASRCSETGLSMERRAAARTGAQLVDPSDHLRLDLLILRILQVHQPWVARQPRSTPDRVYRQRPNQQLTIRDDQQYPLLDYPSCQLRHFHPFLPHRP